MCKDPFRREKLRYKISLAWDLQTKTNERAGLLGFVVVGNGARTLTLAAFKSTSDTKVFNFFGADHGESNLWCCRAALPFLPFPEQAPTPTVMLQQWRFLKNTLKCLKLPPIPCCSRSDISRSALGANLHPWLSKPPGRGRGS